MNDEQENNIRKKLKNILTANGIVYVDDSDKLEFIEERVMGKHAKPELSDELQLKITEHGRLCDSLKKLYATKNADYGDSMHPLFEEYGLTAFLILFSTKINRIKNLNSKEFANYESIEDSLMDLANYALIALTEIKSKKLKDSKK